MHFTTTIPVSRAHQSQDAHHEQSHSENKQEKNSESESDSRKENGPEGERESGRKTQAAQWQEQAIQYAHKGIAWALLIIRYIGENTNS